MHFFLPLINVSLLLPLNNDRCRDRRSESEARLSEERDTSNSGRYFFTNEEERNNIDQKFGIERAIACDAITKLAKKHRKAEQTLANKLGILNSSHYL